MLKTCKCCEVSKDTSEFYTNKKLTDGLASDCKECVRDRNARRYAENSEEIKEKVKKNYCPNKNRNQKLKKNYGISLEGYEHMLKEQNYQCKICKTTDPKHNSGNFVVDHCHDTNTVRGLLCNHCNIMLGHSKDNIDILNNAIKYLNSSRDEGHPA